MTKKSSKTAPSQLQENIVLEEAKPSSVRKKASNEIDEIFAGNKRKKADADKRTDKVITKKSSKTAPSQLQENVVLEEAKPSSVPKKASNEIDEIFAGKKRKKADADKGTDKVKKNKKNKKKTDRPDEDDDKFIDRPSRPRKKTEDGLSLYTEEELGLNKQNAGGTPLCPFDCSCCF